VLTSIPHTLCCRSNALCPHLTYKGLVKRERDNLLEYTVLYARRNTGNRCFLLYFLSCFCLFVILHASSYFCSLIHSLFLMHFTLLLCCFFHSFVHYLFFTCFCSFAIFFPFFLSLCTFFLFVHLLINQLFLSFVHLLSLPSNEFISSENKDMK